MRILLTGAAGFIGSATDRSLRQQGHEVIGVDALLPTSHRSRPEHPAPDLHVLDVRQALDWVGLLRGVDVVCHLAALVGAGTTAADLPAYASTNDLGTASLLAGMAAARVTRFVQASSMVVYGEGRYTCRVHGSTSPMPRRLADLADGRFDNLCSLCGGPLDWGLVTEDTGLDPRSAYAASKVAQEHYAAAWSRQVTGSAVSLRYHNVYGPGMPRDTPYSGVAAIFRSALETGGPLRVFEDGRQMRDFVHLGDVARATVLAIEAVGGASLGGHRTYNVCSGTPIDVLDVARYVASGQPAAVEPEVTGEYRLGDVRHVVASPERARLELGFVAEVDPEAGLRRFSQDPLRGSATTTV